MQKKAQLMLQILLKNFNKIIIIDDILVNMVIGGKSTENYKAFIRGQLESLWVRQKLFGKLVAYLGILKPIISFKRK